jgi:DtxR family Mn-dependent transcriptional regulator
MEIRQSAEDYLEAILILSEKNGSVRSIDVANYLGYSKPSVSIAMKKLRENGYISVDEHGHLTLEEPGAKIAENIYERHRVLSKMFQGLGVPEEVALADACKVEHDLSDVTFSCIKNHVAKYSGALQDKDGAGTSA